MTRSTTSFGGHPPVIRPARVSDLPAIMALETSIFGTDAWSEAALLRDVSDPNCVYVVAEVVAGVAAEVTAEVTAEVRAETTADRTVEKTRVIGYAGLMCPPGSGDGDIQTIAVAPEARGLGLGRALMLVLLDRAAERLADRVFLEVRVDNDVARALYGSLGFEEIAVRPQYYQPEGIDAVIMRREEALPPRRGMSIGSEVLS